MNGTEGLCDNQGVVGVCTCRPGTTGANCDKCLPGYYGLHLGGCRPCDCCGNGSVNGSCDQVNIPDQYNSLFTVCYIYRILGDVIVYRV